MASKKEIHIWIDSLTNSIVNTISGDSLPTEVTEIKSSDFKMITKSRGWNFNWKAEAKSVDTSVYKLTVINNPDIIQGLISIQDKFDHIFVNIIENAPFNIGKNKLYEGVPGNLFAFACKMSWDCGYQGFVSFISKTALMEHYNKTIGAVNVFGQRMVIEPKVAFKLIKHYYPDLK
ncbi:MAG: hypothetical protein IPO62_13430 [Saprospiraceae bacterium]|nr:hypothetical protein [Saprospiraceae bacterium]